MPSAVPVPVVEGLARGAPCSITTPSKPARPAELEGWTLAVVELLAVLEFDEELLPQPASNSANPMIATVRLVFTRRNGSCWSEPSPTAP